MLKILSDYAKRFDDIVEQSEKVCYDKGWEDAKLLSLPKLAYLENGIERLKDVET